MWGHPYKEFGADHKPRIFKTANIKTAKFKGCLYYVFWSLFQPSWREEKLKNRKINGTEKSSSK